MDGGDVARAVAACAEFGAVLERLAGGMQAFPTDEEGEDLSEHVLRVAAATEGLRRRLAEVAGRLVPCRPPEPEATPEAELPRGPGPEAAAASCDAWRGQALVPLPPPSPLGWPGRSLVPLPPASPQRPRRQAPMPLPPASLQWPLVSSPGAVNQAADAIVLDEGFCRRILGSEPQLAADSVPLGALPDTVEMSRLLDQLDKVNGTIRALDEMMALDAGRLSLGSLPLDSLARLGFLAQTLATTPATVPGCPAGPGPEAAGATCDAWRGKALVP